MYPNESVCAHLHRTCYQIHSRELQLVRQLNLEARARVLPRAWCPTVGWQRRRQRTPHINHVHLPFCPYPNLNNTTQHERNATSKIVCGASDSLRPSSGPCRSIPAFHGQVMACPDVPASQPRRYDLHGLDAEDKRCPKMYGSN